VQHAQRKTALGSGTWSEVVGLQSERKLTKLQHATDNSIEFNWRICTCM